MQAQGNIVKGKMQKIWHTNKQMTLLVSKFATWNLLTKNT